MNRYVTRRVLAAAGTLAFLIPFSVSAQQTPLPTKIRDDLGQTIQVEKNVQEMKTQWSDQSKAMADELAALDARAAELEKRVEKLDLRLGLETARYEENIRREQEMLRVREELAAFLDGVLARLSSFVESDLPFLTQERQGRIASLKTMMVDPEVSSAEKFRRIFEALQIETEYGITVEATQATVTLDKAEVLADVLRLGRVSLLCQTIDGRASAVFNPAAGSWETLPSAVNRDIARAIAMARLERSVELVKLPLGRIIAQ